MGVRRQNIVTATLGADTLWESVVLADQQLRRAIDTFLEHPASRDRLREALRMSRPARPAAVGALRSLGAGERITFFRELISIATEQTESTADAKDLLASLPI